ncbi:hypothetical protein XI05_07425 [Bradyrhizobium sp. CCBAU 11357]|nr:hypothetical protein [Bradyrhizobium sp. CCBAU 11357]
MNTSKRQALDEASKKVAQAFNVPIALVSLVDDTHPTAPDSLPQEVQAVQGNHEGSLARM